MELNDLYAILENRYVELFRLAGDDMAVSVDWYDGARQELKRTIKLLKRHLTTKTCCVLCPQSQKDGKCGIDENLKKVEL